MRIDTQLTVWCSTVLVSQSQIACLGFPWEPRILDNQQYLPKSAGHFKSIQISHLKRGRAGGFGYPPFWDSHIVPFSTSYLWDSILSCIQYWYQLISCVLCWAMLQYIWDTEAPQHPSASQSFQRWGNGVIQVDDLKLRCDPHALAEGWAHWERAEPWLYHAVSCWCIHVYPYSQQNIGAPRS